MACTLTIFTVYGNGAPVLEKIMFAMVVVYSHRNELNPKEKRMEG